VKRRAVIVLATVVALVALGWAGYAWYHSRLTVITDDAYVEGTAAPMSAKVPGQVVEVLARDNLAVKAGEVLVRIDDRDWRAKGEQARAAVLIAERRYHAAAARVGFGREMAASQEAQARAATIRAEAAHESATHMLDASQAAAQARRAALASAVAERDRAQAFRDRADRDLVRARELFDKELVARQFVEYAQTEARMAAAQATAADERVAQARRDLESAEADARMREAGFEPQQLGLRTAQARSVEARAQAIHAEALLQEVRVREAERIADFYTDVYELERRNIKSEEGGYFLTDGRITMAILPWKISAFNGAGIEQPAMDHIGFRVKSLDAFKQNLAEVERQNLQLRAKPLDFDSEGVARMKLLAKCPLGTFQLADPDGTLIDVAEDQ